MKRYICIALAALAACACAKAPKEGPNDDAKLYLESWIQVHHPDAEQTPLGVYILEDEPGTGALVGSKDVSPYLRVEYIATSLTGTVISSTYESLAKQLGNYDYGDYYGPATWDRELAAGLNEAVSSMSVGGSRTFVLPGWLQSSDSYSTAEQYLANVTGKSPVIYRLKVNEVITDINKWETDSIGRYVSRHFPGKGVADSLSYGYYYFRTKTPSSESAFPNDTTIYINYVGRLLNGTVFDTNVKDSAKFYGIYSAARTYGPSAITFSVGDNNATTVKMGSSTLITGFSKILTGMHPHENGTGIFYSKHGYGTTGSSTAIPGYSPLRFDIEIVDKP
ncbi:MAG: FKBP-type peptidyl-prolyl cis-trans isomerase [Bacteroidales bacterium]|nr:FKBP-type peptidyl-prolyl cis-trans isomerase [Bacteroidales bacterium]